MSSVDGLHGVDWALLESCHEQVWAWRGDGFGVVSDTPDIGSERLDAALGFPVRIKLETLQETGSFKERGALARLLSLDSQARARGVIAASAGNHAQGVARHAARLGVRAVIVMPEGTPSVKVRGAQLLGAHVRLQGSDFDGAQGAAMAMATDEALTMIHPFDDPWVIAGQSTLWRELLRDHPEIDTLAAPVGGGGLLAGAVLAARVLGRSVRFAGIQAGSHTAMVRALAGEAGLPVNGTGALSPLAEGIAVKAPGRLTMAILREADCDMLVVDEPAVEQAMNTYMRDFKLVAEGAGAASLAGLTRHVERFAGRTVGTVLCGGNIDPRLLSSVILRGLVRSGRMSRLRIELVDIPGELVRVSTVIAAERGNIIDVAYHRIFSDLPAKATFIDITVESEDAAHMQAILDALTASGFKVETAAY